MPGKQAKTLSTADLKDLLIYASCTRHALRNAVIVLLSAKAGLRAGEIANLPGTYCLMPPARSAACSSCGTTPPRKAAVAPFPFTPTSLPPWLPGARSPRHPTMSSRLSAAAR